jgi:hypothetical protein
VLIYRDIDIPFAVACLAALPFNDMVLELKSAVPSIQSDFSRLRTVALVGEELGHLWEQEALQELFQRLQSNSKWWHVLSSLGVNVDLKTLQDRDTVLRANCIRSIVPELFQKSGMDLELVTDYCREFDVEPEYAALTYTELLLTAPPTSPTDFSWVSQVRSAAESVQERALLQRLREVLHRICAVDYEKVQFVCTWIIELLATEEAPEDAGNEDSDYTTTNFSVKDKPQKVSTAVLLAERGVARELETYKRYLDIVGYLSGLRFSSAVGTAHNATLAAVYNERVPLWPLLSDPWSVLDPLLTQMPESAAKLAPLCAPLRLDKSDFNFRKIVALYTRMTSHASVHTPPVAGPDQARSASHIEGKRAALSAAAEAIEASLLSPTQQMELWHWVYERESREGDDGNALAALDAALAVARTNPAVLVSQSRISVTAGSTVEDSLLAHFSNELRTLRCRCTVRRFAATLPDSPAVCEQLLSLIGTPAQLLRFTLEVVAAVAWDIYMQGANAAGTAVTVHRLSQEAPSTAVLHFVSKAATAVDEIAHHCALDTASAQQGDPSSGVSSTPLEQLRHTMVARLLSDVDNQSTERDGGAAGAKGLHGADSASGFNPSTAERRRREDLFFALSIAALVLTSSSLSQRYASPPPPFICMTGFIFSRCRV